VKGEEFAVFAFDYLAVLLTRKFRPPERHTPLFWHKRTEVEEEAKPTEGTVEKVLGHRVVGGRTQFLVRWGENGEESWAEVEDFLRGVNEEWWKYCREKGVGLDLRDVRLERL
jgi:hypothetical protein